MCDAVVFPACVVGAGWCFVLSAVTACDGRGASWGNCSTGVHPIFRCVAPSTEVAFVSEGLTGRVLCLRIPSGEAFFHSMEKARPWVPADRLGRDTGRPNPTTDSFRNDIQVW